MAATEEDDFFQALADGLQSTALGDRLKKNREIEINDEGRKLLLRQLKILVSAAESENLVIDLKNNKLSIAD